MSNYEGKLGEWLKYVQQQIEAARQPESEEKQEDRQEEASPPEEQEERPERIIMRDRMGRAAREDIEHVEAEEVIADSSLIEPMAGRERSPALFEEEDVPDVEDFLPFLREPDRQQPVQPAPPPPGFTSVAEGTGEPKLVEPKPEVRAELTPVDRQEAWDMLPKHIQMLFARPQQEVAQRSYKKFNETREELVGRLLDPTLSLEEAARILNVCPTTVRRYTNRSLLRHFRTAGNQRRFRLSDVLAFLESMR